MWGRAGEFVDGCLEARVAEGVAVFAEGGGTDCGGEAVGVGCKDEVEELGLESKVAFAVQDAVDEGWGDGDVCSEVEDCVGG